MPRALPRAMYEKHGAYYLVKNNKWTRLAGNLHDALVEYARLTTTNAGGFKNLVAETLIDLRKTVAPRTYEVYAYCAERVNEAFAEFAPEQIKPHHIARFLDDNKDTLVIAKPNGVFALQVGSQTWPLAETAISNAPACGFELVEKRNAGMNNSLRQTPEETAEAILILRKV